MKAGRTIYTGSTPAERGPINGEPFCELNGGPGSASFGRSTSVCRSSTIATHGGLYLGRSRCDRGGSITPPLLRTEREKSRARPHLSNEGAIMPTPFFALT